jgi:hypothetical protein
MDILFICKQVFEVDLKGLQIWDDRRIQVFNDTLMLMMFNMHEGEEYMHIYVDVDPISSSLTFRMPKYYSGKPNDGRSPGTKYFLAYDDDVK